MDKDLSRIRVSYREIFGICFNVFMLSVLELTPNCDNTRNLHPSLLGNVNLELACKEVTQTAIAVLMYTAPPFGGIRVGKDLDVQILSSEL